MAVPSLPADHPLQDARWIWPDPMFYLHNHFAQFRKEFLLDAVPAAAPFFITADAYYKLFVNGRFVCRGPARGYQHHWPFDEVDLAPWLRAGKNWIAVEAYNPGTSTFKYLHASQARFLCAARWPGLELRSDLSWQQRRSPAHRTETARRSMQIDYQEHVDARRDDRAWIHADDASQVDWSRGDDHRYGHRDEFPASNACYRDLEERGIPLLREELLTPAGVVASAEGASRDGYRDAFNVSWHWIKEAQGLAWRKEALPSRVDDGWLVVDIPATGTGRFRALAVDGGEYVVANLLVEADGAAGGEILDFQHDETFQDGVPGYTQIGGNCKVAMANRLVLREGRTAHEFFHVLGFRALTVIARDLERPLRLRLRLRRAGYPFAMRGGFTCSEAFWNDLHAACRRTQQACALDAYVDTPWREQAQWWGDARVQAWNTFHLDGDARLLARGIRSIADQEGPEGLTFGHAPTCAYGCVLPDFALTWVLTLWDHYWQTGETDLIRERWPRVQEVLAYFDGAQARGPHGLLRYDPRFWLFEDWSTLYKGAVPTFLNLWYLEALRKLTRLLEVAGMAAEAADIGARAAAHEALVLAHLHDPETGLFANGLDEQGARVAGASVHDQALALLLDLRPQDHAAMIERRLLPFLRGEALKDVAIPSPFWSAYVIEVMERRGYGAECLAFMRRGWGRMLATGTTWEMWDHNPNHGTVSHAWTSHPCYHLVRIVTGVHQEAPRWERVSVRPQVPAELDHASCLVPAPVGDIACAWRKEGGELVLSLQLPDGVTADIELPDGQRRTHSGSAPLTLRCSAGACAV